MNHHREGRAGYTNVKWNALAISRDFLRQVAHMCWARARDARDVEEETKFILLARACEAKLVEIADEFEDRKNSTVEAGE